MKLKTSVAALTLVATAACGPPETFDRAQMLSDTVDNTIEPTHSALGEKVDELHNQLDTFCADDPQQSELEAARTAWSELQEPLKHIQAWSFNMSPYRGKSFGLLVYKIDKEPAIGANIEAAVAGGDARYQTDMNNDGDEDPDRVFPEGEETTIDEAFLAEQSYLRRAKGYPAVEYLLYGSPDDDTSTLEAYQAGDEAATRRCEYLLAASGHAKGVIEDYVEAWSADGGNFAELFESESPDDMDWTTIQDSVNAMVSQMVFITKERLSKEVLGGPLGQFQDNARVPDRVSSPYAETSLEQAKALLAGVEMLYRSPNGQSLADYAAFRKQAVADLIDTRFEAAKTALDEIPAPLATAVEDSPEKVEAAQTAVDELVAAIEADLKTTLGASTTRVVVDND